jgi:hypothetical protein
VSSPQPPDLLDPNDPDWQSFQSKDPDWFLKVAGDAIRVYCGWHLYPNITATEPQLPIGAKGIIMLPSRHVTDVASVTVFPKSDQPCVLDPDTDYIWDEEGWIQRSGFPLWGDVYSGYYYGNDPYYLPVWQAGIASVVFNHGYDEVPADIKEVAYELATSTTMFSASPGTIKEIATPGFRLSPGADFGANLSVNQRNRLANYRIGGVI